MNPSAIPWDFVLILAVLGVLIPWRGTVRIKQLLNRPELTAADRLSLYGSTIAFQWIIVAIIAWRVSARGLSPAELGLAIPDPWETGAITVGLTGLLCAIQLASVRRMVRLPVGERGPVFEITEKIMPHSLTESLVFAALACKAGLSEEFLYRGFVFAVFRRLIVGAVTGVVLAAVGSSLWFAVAHLYQGRRGILTTFVVGMIFCVARIFSRNLFPPMAGHIGIDLIAGLYISNSLRINSTART